jgi:Tfp pilus assembly protein PilN
MININLIAERRSQRLREATILRFSILAVVLLAAVMVTLNLVYFMLYVSKTSEKYSAEQRKVEISKRHKEYITVVDQINPLKKVNELLGQVTVSEDAWMYILADLSRTIPADVAVGNIAPSVAKEGVSLRITGTAKDETAVGGFLLALPRDTRWADTPFANSVTKLNASPTDPEPGVSYDITVPVRDLYGGDL